MGTERLCYVSLRKENALERDLLENVGIYTNLLLWKMFEKLQRQRSLEM